MNLMDVLTSLFHPQHQAQSHQRPVTSPAGPLPQYDVPRVGPQGYNFGNADFWKNGGDIGQPLMREYSQLFQSDEPDYYTRSPNLTTPIWGVDQPLPAQQYPGDFLIPTAQPTNQNRPGLI